MAVSVLNVAAWLAAAALLQRRRPQLDADTWARCRLQLLLSAGYVLGCAYRSALPVFDVPRLVLVDSVFSSALVGRSVATVAELCFAAQWALLLRGVAQVAGSRFGLGVSKAILPLILVAEACSWTAVLTTSNLGHVIEESIWGLCAALLVASLVWAWPHCRPQSRPMLALICAGGVLYVGYMFGVDVPMYWARWVADEARGHVTLDLAQGLADAASRWVVSHRWVDWQGEVVWMSLYFSVAVWLSIGLVHLVHLVPAGQAPARQLHRGVR